MLIPPCTKATLNNLTQLHQDEYNSYFKPNTSAQVRSITTIAVSDTEVSACSDLFTPLYPLSMFAYWCNSVCLADQGTRKLINN